MFFNVMFYIYWIVLSLLPLIIAIIAPHGIIKKIIACLVVLFITFGLVVIIYKDNECNDKRWNNGICECGGVYEFSGSSQSRMSRHFYYTCSSCGHTEEFSKIMK